MLGSAGVVVAWKVHGASAEVFALEAEVASEVTKLVAAVWTRGVATAAVRESATGQVGYLVAGSEASATSKNSRHQVARSSAPATVTSVSLSKDSCTKIAAAAFSPATASVCHMARCCSESPPW